MPNQRTIPLPIGALIEAGLNPNQWFMLYLLYYQLWDDYVAYQTGEHIGMNALHPDELEDLHQRFYLIFEPVPGDHPKTSPQNFRVSERFTDLLHHIRKAHQPLDHKFIANSKEYNQELERTTYSLSRHGESEQPPQEFDGLEAYDELFEIYPSHLPVDGRLMSARSGDQDAMANAYIRALDSKRGRHGPSHAEILELVQWAKEQSPSMITMGLKKFIDSQEWIGLKQLHDSGGTSTDMANDI